MQREELDAFLFGLPPPHAKIVVALRRLILRAAPETTETILWNGLSYHRANFGGRVKGSVCQITPRADCIHLGFIHGAFIADPKHLLRGERLAKRYVPIGSIGEIDRRALTALIKAAAKYDPCNPTQLLP
ncbi:MAG TPA: DUF1801 domain-containing protein [Planctomycetota bacterium]|nr:DUF1801 domain-containing protein [Planctomycetota bacterium]